MIGFRAAFFSLAVLALPMNAAEGARAYPLWDGVETVDAYAKRANLPATKRLDLGGGVTLDLMLIPAGRFVMGVMEPAPPVQTQLNAFILLTLGIAFVVVLLGYLSRRKAEVGKLSFSLLWLLLFSIACGVTIGGIVHWDLAISESVRYADEKYRYDQFPSNEKPGHSVTIVEPFYLGKYTVTQAQYKAVIGKNPSVSNGAQLPVELVSWNDAKAFCAALNQQNKLVDATLPTEAQWEYACRAGTRTMYYSGDSLIDLDDVAWSNRNSNNTPHPVGEKKANAFGLYDMHGNVRQWCLDPFVGDYNDDDAAKAIDENDSGRAQRGGSWTDAAFTCRSACRLNYDRTMRLSYAGFRIVAPVPVLH